ncbi:MAG: tetratricopeptide repeat protein [Stigonema ocellatum SAG 48.90 = DSM 106950]|nr:tetratricopeptide repeat protein [Stigonema ocellatum SAG 48.90 = DSM 106950]
MNSQPPLPNNEIARLDALRQYQVLDTPEEKVFDDFTFLAAQICATPIALISLLDGNRQWFKSKVGLTVCETSRDVAFCAYTILQHKPLVVKNALLDPRFATNPLVTSDPNIRFYAGAPLVTSEGFAIGTLCVIDIVPRSLSLAQVEALKVLSSQVIAQLELRRHVTTMSHTIIQRQQAAAKIRSQHDFIELFYHRGMDLARKGDYKGAIADFNQYLLLNPNGVKAYYNRGMACRQLGDNKGAMADFDIYLRVNPNDAEARSNRGLLRFELGDYKGAMADYSHALRINPNAIADYDPRVMGAEVGDNQEVVMNYTQSLQLNPDDTEADMSFLKTDADDREEPGAIVSYTQSLHFNPDDTEADMNLPNNGSGLGEGPGAILNYTHSVHINQGHTPFDLNDYTDESVQSNPNDATTYLSRGQVYLNMEDYSKAIENYTQSLLLNPNDATAYLRRGHAYSELGNYPSAIEDYTQSLQINSYNATAYMGRATAHFKLEDYISAIEDYTQFLLLNPYDATAYISRGHARSKLKDYSNAIEDYKKAREVSTIIIED